MRPQFLNYEIDHVETLGRKEGVLYLQKGYHRRRDLLFSFLESLDSNIILISAGRDLSKIEKMEHFNLRSVIRIKGNEPSGIINWSENMNVFRYVTSSLEKAIFLAEDFAQRGDIVLFSPYGSREEISDWFMLFDKNIRKIGL
jgi:UDP-N-acetylmuramoylalanine-D-glutamate ligase